MSAAERTGLRERAWTGAVTPWDDWMQVLSGPTLMYSLYRRDWRLFIGTLCWMVYSSIGGSPAANGDACRRRAVCAQRWWSQTKKNGTLGLSAPNSYHTASVLMALYTVAAAWRQQRFETTLGTVLTFSLYWLWVGHVLQQYEQSGPSMRRFP